MGLTITATNSKYEFDMGYGGFYNLRKNIAFALDKEIYINLFISVYNFTYLHIYRDRIIFFTGIFTDRT